jgi:hypothetical protein
MSPAAPRPRRAWSRPLADFVHGLVDPVVARQGFGQSDLLLHWDEIAGERLAAICEPVRLIWPPRGPKRSPDAAAEPATLVLRVANGFGLDLQHLAPVLIERVNAHLGWRCVGRLRIDQGRLERRKPAAAARPAAPAPAALARAQALTGGIEDPGLREALDRLGARICEGRTQRE